VRHNFSYGAALTACRLVAPVNPCIKLNTAHETLPPRPLHAPSLDTPAHAEIHLWPHAEVHLVSPYPPPPPPPTPAACSNVVQLRSIMHIPKACVSEGSTSRSKRDKLGGCWGLLLELLQVGVCDAVGHLQCSMHSMAPKCRVSLHDCDSPGRQHNTRSGLDQQCLGKKMSPLRTHVSCATEF
jgi:hypothetical protein